MDLFARKIGAAALTSLILACCGPPIEAEVVCPDGTYVSSRIGLNELARLDASCTTIEGDVFIDAGTGTLRMDDAGRFVTQIVGDLEVGGAVLPGDEGFFPALTRVDGRVAYVDLQVETLSLGLVQAAGDVTISSTSAAVIELPRFRSAFSLALVANENASSLRVPQLRLEDMGGGEFSGPGQVRGTANPFMGCTFADQLMLGLGYVDACRCLDGATQAWVCAARD